MRKVKIGPAVVVVIEDRDSATDRFDNPFETGRSIVVLKLNAALLGNIDELNTCGLNRISHFKDVAVKTYDLDPAELGLARSTIQDLRGGTPDESAVMMREMFTGKLKGARRDAVILNAAAALAAESGDFKSALDEAAASIDNGSALAKLNALVEFSQSFQTVS